LDAPHGLGKRAGSAGHFGIRASRAGQWVLLLLIRFYMVCLSPLFGGACKFYPSCSNYAWEAIERHGARRGAVLAVKRLLRCHPFTKGGVDLVPDTDYEAEPTVATQGGPFTPAQCEPLATPGKQEPVR
jgi:putative membrane protein insertion efficiency factor